jgi:hypothetical protein
MNEHTEQMRDTAIGYDTGVRMADAVNALVGSAVHMHQVSGDLLKLADAIRICEKWNSDSDNPAGYGLERVYAILGEMHGTMEI